MNCRALGKTGLQVSEIGFGGWAIGGNANGNSYGWTDDDTAVDAVKRAIALGCTLFDTADLYGFGHGEELLGVAFSELGLNLSDAIVVATKVGGNFYSGPLRPDFSPAYIRYAADQSLRRLARAWIDIYLCHHPTLAQMQDGGIFSVMDELKRAGKVRSWGVTVDDEVMGRAAIAAGAEVVQVAYNVLTQEAAHQLFPEAQAAGVGIITCSPLGNGLLTGKYGLDSTWASGDLRATMPRPYVTARVQAAEQLRFLEGDDERTLPQALLRFVLDNPAVSSAVVGIKTPAQADEDLAAAHLPPISQRERRLLDGLLFG